MNPDVGLYRVGLRGHRKMYFRVWTYRGASVLLGPHQCCPPNCVFNRVCICVCVRMCGGLHADNPSFMYTHKCTNVAPEYDPF